MKVTKINHGCDLIELNENSENIRKRMQIYERKSVIDFLLQQLL
jgi:hypothetical protein